MLGTIIGSYRVVRTLGEGGMGAVHLAEHVLLGRPAAIKVLRPDLAQREEQVRLLFHEARAATSVKHPGIVDIYDFGYLRDGRPYLVMEYLEGESLAARLRRTGPLSERRAVALARQIAGALGAAHAHGVVHRDLKPDNIFIVKDADIAEGERIKVLDFGIATLASEPADPAIAPAGMVIGTPAYMAPEQCKRTGKVDARTDLYALGCILFEMVCGRPPFVDTRPTAVMASHIDTQPPSASSLATVSTVLDALLRRALAKEPKHRFRSADDMVAALQTIAPAAGFGRAATAPSLSPSGGLPASYGQTTMSAAAGVATPSLLRVRLPWPVALAVTVLCAGVAFAVVRGRTAAASTATPDVNIEHVLDEPPAPPVDEPGTGRERRGVTALRNTDRCAPQAR